MAKKPGWEIKVVVLLLRYLPWLLRHGPAPLFAMLNEALHLRTPWIERLQAVLRLAHSLLGERAPAGPDDLAGWFGVARDSPACWASLVRDLEAELCFRAATEQRLATLKHHIVKNAGALARNPPAAVAPPPPEQDFCCPACEASFPFACSLG